MSKNFLRGLLAALIATVALMAQAQNTFNGVNIFATGDNPPLDGFNPGTTAALQLYNDGTHGDVATTDGIWSCNYTPAAVGARADDLQQWKVASTGFSPVSIPGGTDNSFFKPLAGQNVKFVFDTRHLGDGFSPDGVLNTSGYLYTIPSPIAVGSTITSVTAVGAFQSELGGSDWNAGGTEVRLKDDGLVGTDGDTTASDGIYTGKFTGVPAGAYDFKIIINGPTTAFDRQICAIGFGTGGGNLNVTIIAPTDVITIYADCVKGRTRVVNSNPAATAGPPWYATSDAWGQTLDSTTQMYDDGTHGDAVAGDGVYARQFTVGPILPADSTTGTVRVRQGIGPYYPGTGNGYPFHTSATNQTILVQFDQNTYGDGFSPNTRYVWTDPNSRRAATYVQVVGDFQVDFGGGSDWNANDSFFQLADAGAAGDVTAGDKIFAKTMTGPAETTKNWKAVGQAAFSPVQYGGTGDGATFQGNNPNVPLVSPINPTFQVDTVTGRIGISTGKPTFPPNNTRDRLPVSAVSDWSIY